MEIQNGHFNSTLVTKNINKMFDSLFTYSKTQNLIPHVCILCNEFLDSNNKSKLKLETLKSNYKILITSQTKSLSSLLKNRTILMDQNMIILYHGSNYYCHHKLMLLLPKKFPFHAANNVLTTLASLICLNFLFHIIIILVNHLNA